jgi:hypothetical protein
MRCIVARGSEICWTLLLGCAIIVTVLGMLAVSVLGFY